MERAPGRSIVRVASHPGGRSPGGRGSTCGELVPVSLVDMRALIDKHICGVPLVRCGSACILRMGLTCPRGGLTRMQEDGGHKDESEPDANVLDQIYRHELAWWIPRVES